MSRRAHDRCLELERVITGRFLVASPASVRAFNQLLTAVSRAQGRSSSTSALVVSLFNRMVRARASPNKVAVALDLHTYNIIICSFCSMGC